MKPTPEQIAELAADSGFTPADFNDGRDRLVERIVHLALERYGAGAGGGEPVYAFRRKGQDSFCTCDESRYLELSEKPNLFEVQILYTHPSPTDLRAEYLRGLEDAARVAAHNVDGAGWYC